MSQTDLSFSAGISISFLSDIECGNKWPSSETISKIAAALKIESFSFFSPELRQPKENKVLIENNNKWKLSYTKFCNQKSLRKIFKGKYRAILEEKEIKREKEN